MIGLPRTIHIKHKSFDSKHNPPPHPSLKKKRVFVKCIKRGQKNPALPFLMGEGMLPLPRTFCHRQLPQKRGQGYDTVHNIHTRHFDGCAPRAVSEPNHYCATCNAADFFHDWALSLSLRCHSPPEADDFIPFIFFP